MHHFICSEKSTKKDNYCQYIITLSLVLQNINVISTRVLLLKPNPRKAFSDHEISIEPE